MAFLKIVLLYIGNTVSIKQLYFNTVGKVLKFPEESSRWVEWLMYI